MQRRCLLVAATWSQEITEVKEQQEKKDQNMNFNVLVTVF